MKKRYLGFATISLVAAFGLAACGSESEPNAPKDETHFNTLDEAPECTSYNEGDTITVGKNKIQYLCEDNEWVKLKAPSSSDSNGDDPASSGSKDDNQTILTEGSMPNGLAIIGNQVWAGKNLDVEKNSDGKEVGRCYKDSEENCKTFGRLYTWTETFQIDEKWAKEEAEANIFKKNHQGLCPEGYHIPTGTDWKNLVEYVNSTKAAQKFADEHDDYEADLVSGILLRSTVYDGKENKVWNDDGVDIPGIDAFGLMLVGTGYADSYEDCQYDEDKEEDVCTIKWDYNDLMGQAFYFVSSGDDETAVTYGTKSNDSSLRDDWARKTTALPVRCIMNMTAKEYKETDEYKKMVEEAKK